MVPTFSTFQQILLALDMQLPLTLFYSMPEEVCIIILDVPENECKLDLSSFFLGHLVTVILQ